MLLRTKAKLGAGGGEVECLAVESVSDLIAALAGENVYLACEEWQPERAAEAIGDELIRRGVLGVSRAGASLVIDGFKCTITAIRQDRVPVDFARPSVVLFERWLTNLNAFFGGQFHGYRTAPAVPNQEGRQCVDVQQVDGSRVILAMSREAAKLSSDGFAWGKGGNGPRALAQSLISSVLGTTMADAYYMRFSDEWVSSLPKQSWSFYEVFVYVTVVRYAIEDGVIAQVRGQSSAGETISWVKPGEPDAGKQEEGAGDDANGG